MNNDLKVIKKKYGEEMMHFARENFATILETNGLLPKLLEENFYPNHDLYKDLLASKKLDNFLRYIYSLVNKKEEENVVLKSAKELMDDAGYILYECKSEDDIQKFRHYYAYGEELCTFRENRLNSCYVFFAVKKDVDNILRKDFKNPNRQDEYGTSVISIQFDKNESHRLSIKNRYNHTVSNPDATYSNNLENIIPGLTKAFEKDYGIVQKYKSNDFELDGYLRAGDGKYYKYNYEINNIYYCPNNIIIDARGVHKFASERYIVLDYFIIDLKLKGIYLYDKTIKDPFCDNLRNIENVKVNKESDKKEIIINTKEHDTILILDSNNRIISYKNEKIKEIKDVFLGFNEVLKELYIPNVDNIGDRAFLFNKSLKVLNAPSLETIGNNVFKYNEILEEINCPNLIKIGYNSFENNKALKILNMPSLMIIGDYVFGRNKILEEINCPNLKEIGDYAFYCNKALKVLSMSSLEKVGTSFLSENEILEEITCPNLRQIGDCAFERNKALKTLNMLLLEKVGLYVFCCNEILEEINCPNLREIGDCSFKAIKDRVENKTTNNLEELIKSCNSRVRKIN